MTEAYSRWYRIFHWAIAIAFAFLLITIFLRLTWLNRDNTSAIMGSYLKQNGVELSQDQLIVLAKQIREPMWKWHVYTGYLLVGLFTLRLFLLFSGRMKLPDPFNERSSFKEKFQKWTYVIFYIGVVISLVTGLIIEFGPKEIKKTVESIHELSIYYLVPFIILHLAGVLIAEFTDQKGIISRIISGGPGERIS